VLITFSPRGVPDGFRHMNGYGSHTFKWVNKEGKAHWVKFHFITDQGIKNLTHEQAVEIAGINPDYSTEDLLQNIQNGNGPSWTFKVQVMPLEDAASYKFDPFDLTKVSVHSFAQNLGDMFLDFGIDCFYALRFVCNSCICIQVVMVIMLGFGLQVWSHKDYPLREVGKLKFDRNVTNYFSEVEQASFSPAHMVPGIEASPDRVLQARLFAYDDASRYRLGPNYLQVCTHLQMKFVVVVMALLICSSSFESLRKEWQVYDYV